MQNQPTPEIELLRAAYADFNARDIEAALGLVTPDVAWPMAFKGGFVRGPEGNPRLLDGAVERDRSARRADGPFTGQVLDKLHEVVSDTRDI